MYVSHSIVTKAAASISNLVILPKLRLTGEIVDNFDIAFSAGLGFGFNTTGDITTTIQGQNSNVTAKGARNSAFVWSIGTGADYYLTDRISVGASVDYLGLGNAKWTGYTSADPTVTLSSLDVILRATMKF